MTRKTRAGKDKKGTDTTAASAVREEERPERQRWKKILLLFCTILLLLAGTEAVLRLTCSEPPESRWSQHHFRVGALGFTELNEIMEPDPDLFWRVRPNLQDQYVTGFVGTETFLYFPVTTDAKGLRVMGGSGLERNLLFLGDSCTFGIGVKAKETCAALTAAGLDARARNLSSPGYTFYQGNRLLKRLGWEPHPMAVVAAFGFNDRLMWDGLTDPDHARLLGMQQSFLARKSRLVRCVELALHGSLRLRKGGDGERTRRVPPELFKAEAKALVKEARRRGVKAVFLFWPRIEWMDEPGSGHPYAEVIRELADGEEVAILDLAETFRKEGGKRLYLDGIHPTPEGHAVAAKRLMGILEDLGVGN